MSSRRVSYEQLESMWEFLNVHRDIAVGFNKSAQARAMSRRLWMELAETLNSFVNCATKDWKNWSNYWIDYKGKLKRKCAKLRLSHTRTGGGPSNVPDLTEVELKFLSILGEDLGSGLPGIQVAVNTGTTHATSSSSPSLINTDLQIFGIINAEPMQASEQPLETHETEQLEINQPPQSDTHQQQQQQSTIPHIQVDSAPVCAQVIRPQRRRRRVAPMSQEAARRALVDSSRVRAEATQEISNSLRNIDSILCSRRLSFPFYYMEKHHRSYYITSCCPRLRPRVCRLSPQIVAYVLF